MYKYLVLVLAFFTAISLQAKTIEIPQQHFTLWADGFNHMFTSLNSLWAEHEALMQLRNCEQAARQAMNAE